MAGAAETARHGQEILWRLGGGIRKGWGRKIRSRPGWGDASAQQGLSERLLSG